MKLTTICTIALFVVSFNSKAICLLQPSKCDKPKGDQVVNTEGLAQESKKTDKEKETDSKKTE